MIKKALAEVNLIGDQRYDRRKSMANFRKVKIIQTIDKEVKIMYNDNVGHSNGVIEMSKATIKDIANDCGVSIKTVSRVLNNSSMVSEETKEKVYDSMKRLNYQVNILARGLKGSRTNIIVIFTERHHEEHLSAWHNIMLKYLFSYAKEKSLKAVMSPSNSQKYLEDETDGFYLLTSGIADGAILLENVHQDSRVEYFKKTNIPYVVFGEPEDKTIPSVSLDNYEVGYKGGEFLIGKHYKKIAFLIGEEKFLSTQLRIRGFQEAVAKSKDMIEHSIYTGVDTIEKAYNTAKKILCSMDVDAFFVSGDERAIGVYRAIYERGLRIPEDVSVLGIDNIPLGQYLYPPISTIEQNFELLAKRCIDKLSKLMNHEKIGKDLIVEKFPCSIIERKSTL